jgi:hypothetical protein
VLEDDSAVSMESGENVGDACGDGEALELGEWFCGAHDEQDGTENLILRILFKGADVMSLN